MSKYILRRFLEMIPTTLGIIILTFTLFYVVGGSPALTVLGQHASQESIASFEAQYGYDKPLFFGNWYPVNALKDKELASALPAGTYRKEKELAFALPAGTYRLGKSVDVNLESLDDRSITTLTAQDTVDVPKGWRLVSISEPLERIQRKTQNFFDSQFFAYMGKLVRLDFGMSVETDRPVLEVLKGGVWASLSLSIPILVFGSLTSVIFGLLCAASRGGTLDRCVLGFSTLLLSVNYVVWILLGQFLLGFKWEIFPLWGWESAYYLVLPVGIGVLSSLGGDIRFYRAAILDEVYKPYVRTAQAKGISEPRRLFVHILRNSLIPIVTYISLSIPYLFTGSLLLESFFGIPGLGSVSINAIHSSDMTVIQGVVVIGAFLYQIINLATDICYGWLDPRVRMA